MTHLLIIKNLKIQNANALSSPFTIGFPSMTAWLGAVHALERYLKNNEKYLSLALSSTAVICYDIEIQRFKEESHYLVIGTHNPLKKDGKTPAFIPEPRCHLEVALVIEVLGCDSMSASEQEELTNQVKLLLYSKVKIAGGDIIKKFNIEKKLMHIDNSKDMQKLVRQLMPGFVLIDRTQLMRDTIDNEGKDALDVLLDYLVINNKSIEHEDGSIEWVRKRKEAKWIIVSLEYVILLSRVNIKSVLYYS